MFIFPLIIFWVLFWTDTVGRLIKTPFLDVKISFIYPNQVRIIHAYYFSKLIQNERIVWVRIPACWCIMILNGDTLIYFENIVKSTGGSGGEAPPRKFGIFTCKNEIFFMKIGCENYCLRILYLIWGRIW